MALGGWTAEMPSSANPPLTYLLLREAGSLHAEELGWLLGTERT